MLACGDIIKDAESFVRLRTALLRTCRELFFISDCTTFWTTYSIAPLKKHAELRAWASGFHTLVFFRKYAYQRRSLSVTLDSYTLPAAIQELRACDLTWLNYLTCERYPEIRPAAKFQKPVEIAFNGDGSIMTLYILQLFDIAFDWSSMGRFSSLTVLVLHNSRLGFAPAGCQLEGLLGCNPSLVSLLLRISFAHLRVWHIILPSSYNTSQLEFGTHSDRVFSDILAACVCPLLTTLSIEFWGEADIDILLGYIDVIECVESFYATGSTLPMCRLDEMLSAIPSIIDLDISDTGYTVFKALAVNAVSPAGGGELAVFARVLIYTAQIETHVDQFAINPPFLTPCHGYGNNFNHIA
ncbi:hypothetical protein B0H17DRAFT_1135544 [Mycena rosella]|uniref:Uncharacterized protein n=1 Tax=Mycena rosella TaxID=1033263 RepID=A0AAD7DES1_MYCRO|nr:hypothetical protein B0H17DRAFT_1135544 [Mycena rosella]